MGEVSLLSIPDEIIELILESPIITIKDVVNLKLVCTFFNEFIMSRPLLWRNKIFSGFSFLKHKYLKMNINDWYEQCRHIVETRKYIHRNIKNMSSNYRWRLVRLSNSDMEHFKEKCKENDGLACHYVMHFLDEIISADSTCEDTEPIQGLVSLTTQHYSKIIYYYILQHHILKSKWYTMVGSGNPYVPDTVAEFAFKWLYPRNKTGLKLFKQLNDSLVEHVMAALLPDHPLRQCDEQIKAKWRYTMLSDNQFSVPHCKTILCVISNLLYQTDLLQMKVTENLKKFQMDEVVSNTECHRTLMHVLFETAARRCGVKLLLKGTGSHQFIYWRESWTSRSPRHLMDPQTGVVRIAQGRCPFSQHRAMPRPDMEDIYNPTELLLNQIPPIDDTVNEFSRHVTVNTIELAYAVAPYIALHICAISNMYIVQNKQMEAIVRHLQTILHGELPVRDREFLQVIYDRALYANRSRNSMNLNVMVQVKQRTPDIMYAAGLICRHLKFEYTCVITGWDATCTASMEWQHTMRIDQLPRGSQQPFYHVVAEDGSERYVAQENLEFLKSPQRMVALEDKISVDFSHFNGYIYVLNAEKLLEYPDDPSHITFFVSKMRRLVE